MSYILRVYFEDKIWNLDLETFDRITIGNSSQDTVVIDALRPSQIIIEKRDEEYQIQGKALFRSESGKASINLRRLVSSCWTS